MMHKILLSGLVLLSGAQALAADPRIKTLSYDPEEIVRIVGHPGIQSTIQFGSDERIENVAVGSSAAWQITPNRRGSLLFVKPLAAVSRTNMTVVTDKRTYMFDLTTTKKGAAAPLYVLKFAYPDAPLQLAPAKEAPVVMASAPPAAEPPTAARLNFSWKVKGSDRMRPQRIFDDGESLYLAWNSAIPLPAILTRLEDSREGPLNYRVAGEYIVLTPVPQNIVLRYGKKAATAWTTRRIEAAPAPAPVSAYVPLPAPTQERPRIIVANSGGAAKPGVATASPVHADQATAGTLTNRVEGIKLSDLLRDNVTGDAHDH
jgi:type IV secretion system protein VirB9